MLIAAIVIGILLIFYVIFCFFAARYVLKRILFPNFSSRDERKKRNEITGISKGTEVYSREDVVFKMPDGYEINADISLNDKRKFVIFAHGHSSTREGSIKYTKPFYKLGYSIVLYDQRGHGDNKRTVVTMGIQESKDLKEIVKQLKEKYGNNIEIGLFGYSMGGATVCLASQYLQNDIKFIVADCAYSSLRYAIFDICVTHKIPAFLTIGFSRMTLHFKHNISSKDCMVYKIIRENRIPICLMHGTKDKVVLPINSKRLYKNNMSSIKELHLFEGAGHSKSIEIYPELYEEYIKNFIEKIGE